MLFEDLHWFDPQHPETVDELLPRARESSRPLMGKRPRDEQDVTIDLSDVPTGHNGSG